MNIGLGLGHAQTTNAVQTLVDGTEPAGHVLGKAVVAEPTVNMQGIEAVLQIRTETCHQLLFRFRRRKNRQPGMNEIDRRQATRRL